MLSKIYVEKEGFTFKYQEKGRPCICYTKKYENHPSGRSDMSLDVFYNEKNNWVLICEGSVENGWPESRTIFAGQIPNQKSFEKVLSMVVNGRKINQPEIEKKNRIKIYDKEYKRKNKEKRSEQNRINYESVRSVKFKKNPQHYLWYIARSRAKQKGFDFDISVEDVVIPELCPITNLELTKGDGFMNNSMSLDRVDNNKGYVKGNVRVISRKANMLKGSLTIETIQKILKYINGEI